jgi:hypothetical protein
MNLLSMTLLAIFAAKDVPDVDTGMLAWLCGGMGIACVLMFLVVALVPLVGVCKVFAKAGQPAWAALVPIYNVYILCEIVRKPEWFIMTLIPCIGLYWGVLLCLETAKVFGKEPGFGIGLMLLGFVFWPILGFGDAQYMGGRKKKRRSSVSDEDDDRPSRRRARDDDDDDDDRPRRRARDDDDDADDEDQPRRKRRPRDDDDD